jgi:type IV pilus assembly protein PilN
MKLEINLASRPYEDARRFYAQWVPLLAGLAALALFLSARAYTSLEEWRATESAIQREQAKIDALDAERRKAAEMLAEPENSGTRDHSRFLNAVFARKAFSWTQVMTDLEKLLPGGVQVVSLKPELNRSGQLQFSLVVATDRRDAAVELVRRMENAERFQGALIRSESRKDEGQGPALSIEIGALYLPERVAR